MVAVSVVAATACATAARVNDAYEDGPPKSVNDDQVLGMLERELQALSFGTRGTIRVWLNVNTEGTVRSVEIAESSGNAQLDAIVLRVLHHLRYEPGRHDGRPVEAWISHTVNLPRPPVRARRSPAASPPARHRHRLAQLGLQIPGQHAFQQPGQPPGQQRVDPFDHGGKAVP